MISKKTVVCASLLTLTIGWSASAQQEGQSLRFEIGVVGVATDNRDAVEDDKTSNVDIFVRPRVELHMDGQSSWLKLNYEPGLRYRSDPGDTADDFDLQHTLGLDARHLFSERARMRFHNRFLVTDDPRIEEDGAVLRGDQSYIWNRAELGLNYDLYRYSNLDLSFRNSLRRYDDDIAATLSDKTENAIRGRHRYSLSPTLRSLLTGEYRMYTYKSGGFASRDFDSLIGAVGLENEFTPNTIGSISVGWQTRSYDDSALDDDGEPYVHAELSGLLNPDLKVGAVAGHGLRDSAVHPYPSQIYTEFKGYADVSVTAKTLLRVSGTYRLSEYERYKTNQFPGGDETILVADAELTYRVTETGSLMTGYRLEDIDADDGVGGSYTRNTFRLGASLNF